MPRHIAKWGRPLPYFMRYRDPYYARQKLSRSPSNMNRLCWELERWDKGIRWKRTFQEFDYSIMIDETATYDEETANAVEQIYLEFGVETRKLHLEQTRVRKYMDADVKAKYSRAEAKNYTANWKSHYDRYRNRCSQACPDIKALANILVKLGYEKYPSRDKKIMWNMAGEGIVANIKQVPNLTLPKRDPEHNLTLPKRDPDGKFEYLGRRYSMVEVGNEEIVILEEYLID